MSATLERMAASDSAQHLPSMLGRIVLTKVPDADWSQKDLQALVDELKAGEGAKEDILKKIGDLAANDAHREFLWSRAVAPLQEVLVTSGGNQTFTSLSARALGNLSYDLEESARAAVQLGCHTLLIAALKKALDNHAGGVHSEENGLVLRNASGALANFASAGLDIQEELMAGGAAEAFARVLPMGSSHPVAVVMASRGVTNLVEGEGGKLMPVKDVGAAAVRSLREVFSKFMETSEEENTFLVMVIEALSSAVKNIGSHAELAKCMVEADGVLSSLLELLTLSEDRARPFKKDKVEEEEEEENTDIQVNAALWDAMDLIAHHDACVPAFASVLPDLLEVVANVDRFDHTRAANVLVSVTASEETLNVLMGHTSRLVELFRAEELAGKPTFLTVFTNLASSEERCKVLLENGVYDTVVEACMAHDVPAVTDLDESNPSVVMGRLYAANNSEELNNFRTLYCAVQALRNFTISPSCKERVASDGEFLKRLVGLTQYDNPHLRWLAVCSLRSLASSERTIEPMRAAGAVKALSEVALLKLPEGQMKINLEAARCVFGLAYGPFNGYETERREVAQEAGLGAFALLLQSEHALLQSEALKMYMMLARDTEAGSDFAKEIRSNDRVVERLIQLIAKGPHSISILSLNVVSTIVKSTGPLGEQFRASLSAALVSHSEGEFTPIINQLREAHQTS